MATFRSSKVVDLLKPTPSASMEVQDYFGVGRPIGEILSEKLGLSAEQVGEIISFAQDRRIRFGDAAVALKYASVDDVLLALAQQFQYAYTPQERHEISDELVMLSRPFSPQAEAFRGIRSQVLMRAFGHGGERRAVAVVSPDSRDGKTFFSANLAIALAQLGGRTLLVDADLRGPRQHEVFHVDNSLGLSSHLIGRADSQIIQPVKSVPGLYVLPVGVSPPNPLELIERPTFSTLMHELISRFDHVIVDTPAAVYGADAEVIAERCGAVLLVARKDESRIGALQALASSMSEGRVRIVGLIVNEF